MELHVLPAQNQRKYDTPHPNIILICYTILLAVRPNFDSKSFYKTAVLGV